MSHENKKHSMSKATRGFTSAAYNTIQKQVTESLGLYEAEEVEKMNDQLGKSEHKYHEAKKWIASLKQENAQLKNQITEFSNASIDSSSMIETMRDKVKKKQMQLYSCEEVIKQLQGQLRGATTGFAKMELEKLQLKEKHKDKLSRTVMGMMESNKKLKENLEKALNENRTAKDVECERNNLIEEMKKKDEAIEQLNHTVKELQDELKKMRRSSETLRKKASNSDNYVEIIESKAEKIQILTKCVEDKEQIIVNLTEQCAKLKEIKAPVTRVVIEKMKKQIAALEEENCSLRNGTIVKSSSQDITGLKSSSQDTVSSLEDMKKTQENALSSLRTMQTQMEIQLKSILEAQNSFSVTSLEQNNSDTNSQEKISSSDQGLSISTGKQAPAEGLPEKWTFLPAASKSDSTLSELTQPPSLHHPQQQQHMQQQHVKQQQMPLQMQQQQKPQQLPQQRMRQKLHKRQQQHMQQQRVQQQQQQQQMKQQIQYQQEMKQQEVLQRIQPQQMQQRQIQIQKQQHVQQPQMQEMEEMEENDHYQPLKISESSGTDEFNEDFSLSTTSRTDWSCDDEDEEFHDENQEPFQLKPIESRSWNHEHQKVKKPLPILTEYGYEQHEKENNQNNQNKSNRNTSFHPLNTRKDKILSPLENKTNSIVYFPPMISSPKELSSPESAPRTKYVKNFSKMRRKKGIGGLFKKNKKATPSLAGSASQYESSRWETF